MSGSGRPVTGEFRLAEPLAALSVATDLVRGQPPGQALYKTAIATKLAGYMGLGVAECAIAYFATLLRAAGCTATSHEFALYLGGDDVAVRFGGDAIDTDDVDQLTSLLTRLGKDGMDPDEAMQVVAEASRADREVGGRVVIRLGLEEAIADSVRHIFERWDGLGVPTGVSGEDIPLATRIGHVASAAAMFCQAGGRAVALHTIERWSGKVLDPAITGIFLDNADDLMSCLDVSDSWQAVLAVEPLPWRMARSHDLDEICSVFAHFIDLKTPFLHGHSARVARLAEGAARALDMSEEDCLMLRRAGLLHDLGRVGISTGIWERPLPLGTLELEQVRMHPYHTERILDRSALFQPLARLASLHHERVDGSGYYRGLPGTSLDRPARVLAAADACAELLEDRPGRRAMSPDAAAKMLAKEALDPDAVHAVLQVAGAKNIRGRRKRPAGLTRREVEVLRLLARGMTLKEVAEALVISESTAHTHASHIYEKAEISTRAGAALFAMENGLLD
jgi:HD-GYP domain-containing protein (c-di-GMP phosphodiesterase class II)